MQILAKWHKKGDISSKQDSVPPQFGGGGFCYTLSLCSATSIAIVAGTWTETKKCITVDFYLKLVDDDV